jgi:integrase
MGNIDDFQGYGRRCQQELDKIDQHTAQDRPHIKRFVQYYDNRVTESTLATYLCSLRRASEELDGNLTDLDVAGLDALAYDLRHDVGLADSTVHGHLFAVRKLLAIVDDDTDWVDEYELPAPDSPPVTPGEMLTPDDIGALTGAATNMRDVALVEFLADTGARISMVGSLRAGDVDLDGDTATFSPNPNATGLKGADIRPYPIIDSRATLRTYLHQTHPRPERDDVAFFHKLPGHGTDFSDGAGALSAPTIHGRLSDLAETAGVDKPTNPHNFRHSAISRMRREGYTRSQIEHRVAWAVDTNEWATYEHIAAEEHNRDIFAQAGVVDDDEGPDTARRSCGNCRETLAPHHSFCSRCGTPADPELRDVLGEVDEATRAELVGAGDPDQRRTVSALADAAEDPAVAEALLAELADRARD